MNTVNCENRRRYKKIKATSWRRKTEVKDGTTLLVFLMESLTSDTSFDVACFLCATRKMNVSFQSFVSLREIVLLTR
jgi:hypothetical protein